MEEAHSPGRRVTGLRQTQKAVLAGRAERVFLAKDADPAAMPAVRHSRGSGAYHGPAGPRLPH